MEIINKWIKLNNKIVVAIINFRHGPLQKINLYTHLLLDIGILMLLIYYTILHQWIFKIFYIHGIVLIFPYLNKRYNEFKK